MKYIKRFEELSIDDVGLVGGKNASLGQMINELASDHIKIPSGFAITAEGYWYFLKHNDFLDRMHEIMNKLTDHRDIAQLRAVGDEIRSLIESGSYPDDLAEEITQAYHALSNKYNQENADVAVRSSATAEDLPEASFAGQQETFLNVNGTKELLEACKKSMASLFTDRAIVYRIEKGFDHFDVALSVGVQKMIRSDLASAGVLFTLDTETGFKDLVMIDSSYGLGEAVVKGIITPDEFFVHKPTLEKGFQSIVKKQCGKKAKKIIYAADGKQTEEVKVSVEEQNKFSLSNDEIIFLARAGVLIENHYSSVRNKWVPMDIEWAKDGVDGQLYIIQARPETIHAPKQGCMVFGRYELVDISEQERDKRCIATGQSIGQQIASGVARIADSLATLATFNDGDILVTQMTDPDWVPIMKKASAIVTERGGRTSHAAIVSRELGIPAIVGAESVTSVIQDGQEITTDCSRGAVGYVYEGIMPFEVEEIDIDTLPQSPVDLMINIGDPDQALVYAPLPVDGVGLARTEFIIGHNIQMHPMAAVHPDRVLDAEQRKKIDELSVAYENPATFFVDVLSQGIGMIAAAFYPKPVLVRTSDFKSNEYRNLIGGTFFEPKEENPMLGLRGASRYYSELYRDAFVLECKAMKRAREVLGFSNIRLMLPFVRTVKEAEQVIAIMAEHDLVRGKDDLELFIMSELPSNVLLADALSNHFDGFSIGSNDLTQMTLGVDRDSELLAPLFDERNPAVLEMMRMAIKGAQRNKKYIGICGQAPSDYPEIAKMLIDEGINSISLNPDSIVPFLKRQG